MAMANSQESSFGACAGRQRGNHEPLRQRSSGKALPLRGL
jgi:hypothetical protein